MIDLKDLVFYTILSCLQIPLLTYAAYLLITNRKKPDREGWHFEFWHIMATLVIAIYIIIVFWNYAYFMTTSFTFPQRFVVPAIITAFCALSSFAAYRVCITKNEKKEWATRDSAKGAFLIIEIYAIAIVAYAWWSFNYHLVIK